MLNAWWQEWNSTYHGPIYHRFGADRCIQRSRWLRLPCLRRWVQDLHCWTHDLERCREYNEYSEGG